MNTRKVKSWLPVLLWMSFIFWMSTGTFSADNTSSILFPLLRFLFSSITQDSIDWIHLGIRKLGHITEYFILGILLFRAFRSESIKYSNFRCAFSSLLLVILYASSDECHQSFVSSRTASIFDVGIDTLGGLFAICSCVLWYHNKGKQYSSAMPKAFDSEGPNLS